MWPYSVTQTFDIEFIVNGIFTPLTCLFGIVGNTLAFLVLRKIQQKQNSIATMLLQVLAVCDSFFLLGAFFPMYVTLYRKYVQCFPVGLAARVVIYLELVWNFLAMLSQTLSIWVTVLLTAERMIGICYSMRAVTWCSKTRIKVCLGVSVVLALLYNGMTLFECYAALEEDPRFAKNDAPALNSTSTLNLYSNTSDSHTTETFHGDITTYPSFEKENGFHNKSDSGVTHDDNKTATIYCLYRECSLTRNSHAYVTVGVILNSVIRYGGPVIAVCCLNIRIIYTMRHSLHARSDLKSSMSQFNAEVRSFNHMCLVVSIVFLVCMIPTNVNFVLGLIVFTRMSAPPDWYRKYDLVADYLVVLNSAVNFIIYCAIRQGFRKQCARLFQKKKCLHECIRPINENPGTNGVVKSPNESETQTFLTQITKCDENVH
ncbi:unnamed protein product [Owenia fusiformis]|uniref:Uncharacterized protein n=1 Tax=Owenia fusiformis TaxID=6347 RepID=A0A8J1U3Y2_OWEFU|nr:unnamed protein product [Owenia fusiformis]